MPRRSQFRDVRIAVPKQPGVRSYTQQIILFREISLATATERDRFMDTAGMSTMNNAPPPMATLPKPLRYGAVPNPCNRRLPTTCSKEERLLLMAGSDGKADMRPGQQVAPIDLYTGVMFETLKKGLPDLDQTRIIILSPKHGLVGKEWPKIAPYYNRPLTRKKAERLIESGLDRPFDDWGRLRDGRCCAPHRDSCSNPIRAVCGVTSSSQAAANTVRCSTPL